MSIYGSLPAPEGDLLVYQGSHIFPSDDDPRGGWVDIAIINGHITRDAKDDGDHDGAPHPFLRFGVNEGKVVLQPHHARQIRDALDWWLLAIETDLETANSRAALSEGNRSVE